MTTADLARSTIVMVVVLAVQNTLLDGVRVAGAHPDAMLLLPMAAGYVAGPDRGAGFGFAAGLLADLFLPTTFGLSALVGCLVGYGTGLATRGLVRSSWWLPLIAAAGATAVGLSMYAILGAVLGEPGALRTDLVPALVVATPAAVVLATPVVRMVTWAMPPVTSGRGASVGAGSR
ncbi:MAG TPA: rod shape-determining protein MreD [Acidimicrobiales bacterium]|nr:rod shape-determining protein MreD [Acidimicrobiales bacterium]